jgi:hypothetical protein
VRFLSAPLMRMGVGESGRVWTAGDAARVPFEIASIRAKPRRPQSMAGWWQYVLSNVT